MPLNADRRRKVFALIPEGIIVPRKWLMEKGFARHSLDNLVKSGLLISLANGIYARADSVFTWQSVIFSFQHIFKADLIIGGISSFELQGLSHYVSFAQKKTIHVYGRDKVPIWVHPLLENVTFFHHKQNLIPQKITNKSSIHKTTPFTKSYIGEREKEFKISNQERAFLEILLDVPEKVSFEYADQLMQGLTSLSPRNLQQILEECDNIKVKRLFLWLAEKYNYSWVKKIDADKIELGSGNRMLVKGGKLDKKYKITIPDFYE